MNIIMYTSPHFISRWKKSQWNLTTTPAHTQCSQYCVHNLNVGIHKNAFRTYSYNSNTIIFIQ